MALDGDPVGPGDPLPEDQALLLLPPDGRVEPVVERGEKPATRLSGEEKASI